MDMQKMSVIIKKIYGKWNIGVSYRMGAEPIWYESKSLGEALRQADLPKTGKVTLTTDNGTTEGDLSQLITYASIAD